LEPKKKGDTRSEDTGVCPFTTHQLFMGKIKAALKKNKDLGGHKPTASQRDEAHAKFHVDYILDKPFAHPSADAGERERLLTCLYYPIRKKEETKPRGSDNLT